MMYSDQTRTDVGAEPIQGHQPETLPPEQRVQEHEQPHAEGSVHLAPASVWPMTCAAGISLLGLGPLTWWPISIIGGVLTVMAVVYWIQELRHEPQHPH